MGKINLQIKAALVNVTDLKPASEDYEWSFKFECTKCHEIGDNFVSFTSQDVTQITNSRGEANLVMKCKFCSSQGNASVIAGPFAYTIDNSEEKTTLLALECRGIEPVEFEPRDEWTAKGTESDTTFDINMSENEFYDYDEKASTEVTIEEVEYSFVASK